MYTLTICKYTRCKINTCNFASNLAPGMIDDVIETMKVKQLTPSDTMMMFEGVIWLKKVLCDSFNSSSHNLY